MNPRTVDEPLWQVCIADNVYWCKSEKEAIVLLKILQQAGRSDSHVYRGDTQKTYKIGFQITESLVVVEAPNDSLISFKGAACPSLFRKEYNRHG